MLRNAASGHILKMDKNKSLLTPVVEQKPEPKPQETGGPKGLEPTRYNDWEHNGKCVDF